MCVSAYVLFACRMGAACRVGLTVVLSPGGCCSVVGWLVGWLGLTGLGDRYSIGGWNPYPYNVLIPVQERAHMRDQTIMPCRMPCRDYTNLKPARAEINM